MSGSALIWLDEERLRPLALSRLPAWLWSTDASHIIWANPVGAAIFGASSAATLARHRFDIGQPAAAQVARLVATLPADGRRYDVRLRGFGAGVYRALACTCTHITLVDGREAILIAASERAGPDLALDDRARRLVADAHEPVAAFSTDGTLLALTDAEWLDSAAEAFTAELVEETLRNGHAEGQGQCGAIALDRFDDDATPVLIATRVPPNMAIVGNDARESTRESLSDESRIDGSETAPTSPIASPPPQPAFVQQQSTGRRHPLRFIWQMDADGRFSLASEEFIELMGAQTAAKLGRRWDHLAAALGLDPGNDVTRAVRTHETWSGICLAWPIDGSDEPLSVELSGLPLFDRERRFRGYRGFGVCRDLARLDALAEFRRAEHIESPTAEMENELSLEPSTECSDVRQPFARTPALTAIESRAFHELARRLTERLGETEDNAIETKDWEALDERLAEAEQSLEATVEEGRAEAGCQSLPARVEKADFLAKVSHEIRTPLNSIIGFSEVMAQERFGPIGNERYRGYLKDIRDSGLNLIALVNDLIDLSKFETGKLGLNFTSVAPNELVRECATAMQPQAKRDRIIIRTSLSPKLPQVMADARSIRQIVCNLISNSLKFTIAGGQVIVSTLLTDAGEVSLHVRDTGVGMSETEIAAVLEPFRNFATSPRFGTGAAGLGLPLAKAMAEANRARFQISSKLNSGTLIEVTFPASSVVAG